MSTSDDAGAVRPRVAAGAGGATPRWFLGWLVPFTAICVAAQTRIAAYTGDLSRTPDEAAHFVNSAMIRDYWVRALGTDPVRFALEYYAHLPRVSVGHWPPFFHAVQAGVFVPTGPTFAAALGLQALAGGASAAPRHGRKKPKQAPWPSAECSHIRPPKCSTIWRLIGKPRPVPAGRW